jgi:hypothetical protein
MANLSRIQREHIRKISAAGHARRALNLKHKGKGVVSNNTMRALQDARLPLSKRAYTKKLRELEPKHEA